MKNETKTKTTADKITEQLATLDWKIEDAKRAIKKAAEAMMRRATEAVEAAEAMVEDKPCSLMWVDSAESDLRDAREARAELRKLTEQHKLLSFLVRSEA